MSSNPTLKAKDRILDALRGLDPYVQDGPGEVFFSGLSTLKRGDFFIMGLNPGGGDAYRTVMQNAQEWEIERFSNYLDQCWQTKCWNSHGYFDQPGLICPHGNGTEKHQRAVQNTARRSGIKDLRDVFATQAVFLKSKENDSFKSEHGFSMKSAFEKCWPVHKVMLSIVQPKVIICLGFNATASPFTFLQKKARLLEPVQNGSTAPGKEVSYRWARVEFNDKEIPGQPLLVGVYHPSWRTNPADCDAYTALIEKELLVA